VYRAEKEKNPDCKAFSPEGGATKQQQRESKRREPGEPLRCNSSRGGASQIRELCHRGNNCGVGKSRRGKSVRKVVPGEKFLPEMK